jgi:hypothetical protein
VRPYSARKYLISKWKPWVLYLFKVLLKSIMLIIKELNLGARLDLQRNSNGLKAILLTVILLFLL